MTDRIAWLTVVLDQDYRDDEAEAIAGAIRQLRGVQRVILGQPVDIADRVNRDRVRLELLFDVLKSEG